MRTNLCGLLIALTTCMLHAQADPSPRFELIGTYKALGGLMATAVAPGRDENSERLYGSYLYADNTLDIVAIDPSDGKSDVFHNPVPGEYGARNIAIGPDGDAYFGTLPHAHFLQLDRKAGRLIDLGRPSASEEYIWDVAFGEDKRLYGVTYPGCRLVRYTPASRKLEDLGRMDATEKYGRWIVGGHDGFMYIGIGTAKANIAVFNTKTGELREILPKDAQVVGIANPYIGVDGKAYATLNDHLFALNGYQIHELPASQRVIPYDADVLKNGLVSALLPAGAGDVWEFPNFSDRVAISLVNHHNIPFDGIIALQLKDLQRIAPKFPGTLFLAAKEADPAQTLETQIDNDEVLVAVHLDANETQRISLYYSGTLHDHLPIIPRVYASHAYGYNRATVAIESERIGYRTYGGFFFDVQAHGKDERGLFNSMLGYASITHPPREGEDIIHLGDTLGVGGIFLRTGSKVFRPGLSTPDYAHRTPKSDEPSYNVIESGPLRAIVEESLPQWIIGPDIVALRARYEMDANQEIVHCQWWITPSKVSGQYEVGAGILTLADADNADADKIVTTAGTQSKAIGNIAVGMSYAGIGVEHAELLVTPGGRNQVVIFPGRLVGNREISGAYTFAAAWSGSGWDDPAAHVRSILAQQSEPPTVSILAHEENPNPKALEAEPK